MTSRNAKHVRRLHGPDGSASDQAARRAATSFSTGGKLVLLPLRPKKLLYRPKMPRHQSIGDHVAPATLQTRSEIGIGLAIAALQLLNTTLCSDFRSNHLRQPSGARPRRWTREYSLRRCKLPTEWLRRATEQQLQTAVLRRDGLSRSSVKPARSSTARRWPGHDLQAGRHAVSAAHHKGGRAYLGRLCLKRASGQFSGHRGGWQSRHPDLVSRSTNAAGQPDFATNS